MAAEVGTCCGPLSEEHGERRKEKRRKLREEARRKIYELELNGREPEPRLTRSKKQRQDVLSPGLPDVSPRVQARMRDKQYPIDRFWYKKSGFRYYYLREEDVPDADRLLKAVPDIVSPEYTAKAIKEYRDFKQAELCAELCLPDGMKRKCYLGHLNVCLSPSDDADEEIPSLAEEALMAFLLRDYDHLTR